MTPHPVLSIFWFSPKYSQNDPPTTFYQFFGSTPKYSQNDPPRSPNSFYQFLGFHWVLTLFSLTPLTSLSRPSPLVDSNLFRGPRRPPQPPRLQATIPPSHHPPAPMTPKGRQPPLTSENNIYVRPRRNI